MHVIQPKKTESLKLVIPAPKQRLRYFGANRNTFHTDKRAFNRAASKANLRNEF